jgi:hypothetical protein
LTGIGQVAFDPDLVSRTETTHLCVVGIDEDEKAEFAWLTSVWFTVSGYVGERIRRTARKGDQLDVHATVRLGGGGDYVFVVRDFTVRIAAAGVAAMNSAARSI